MRILNFQLCKQFILNLKLIYIFKYPMSKKDRSKKTPMFVSNMISNYDFVDYTEPGQPAPSAFGNPTLTVGNHIANQQSLQPKKNQTNWFDQMLSQNQPSKISSPNVPKSAITESGRSPNNQKSGYSISSNASYESGYGPTGYSVTSTQKYEAFEPSFKKQNPFSKQNEYTESFSSQQFSYQNNQSNPKGQEYLPTNNMSKNQGGYQFGAASAQQKKYEFKSSQFKSQDAYTSSSKPTANNNYSSNYSTTFEPLPKPVANNNYSSGYSSSVVETKPQKAQYKQAQNSSSLSSGGAGFTDESIINCLPEPARSNILAMIKRSKGQGI